MKNHSKIKLLIIYLLVLASITGLLYLNKKNDDVLFITNYEFQDFKVDNLNMKVPVSFDLQEVKANNNKAILKDSTFEYEEENFFINITRVTYVDSVNLDLESVYEQRKENLEKMKSKNQTVFFNEDIKINKRNGYKYKVLFKPDDYYELIHKGVVLKDQNTLFLIEFIYKQKAVNAEKLSDKIINSISFTN